MALMMRKANLALQTRATRTPVVSSRRCVVVRAEAETPKAPEVATPSDAPAAVPQPMASMPAQPMPAMAAAVAAPSTPSLFEAMSFANPTGPETINGRLAMIGVLAAVGAELTTDESFVTQFADFTPIVLATWIIISAASLVPLLKGADVKASMGPFTPQAERINGWAAMLGLASLIVIETVKGSALF